MIKPFMAPLAVLLGSVIALNAHATATQAVKMQAPKLAASQAIDKSVALEKLETPKATNTTPAALDKSGTRELRPRIPPPPPPPIIPGDQIKNKVKGMQ